MLLKKLELLGFKSFPEKLKIDFGPGITCIVGPNGCGKTNVSDAIRWVLGEQSAKALRGGSMGDVIFNGTVRRKPVGMAEVALTFSNSGPVLSTGYTDVTIGRRIYRDGVSEYSLNKTACRLKDIRDTFFDTGIGTHAYSLIEQEMVDNVLSDQSGHRRLIFEEAAGITKYKARKREALLKLEATETDLVRVNDILVEVEREANSLRRQIAKARRFKRLEDEMKSLDIALGFMAYSGHDEKVKEATAELELTASRKEESVASMRSLEASVETLKLDMVEKEKTLHGAAEELAVVEEERARVNDRILILKERRHALGSKCDELREDIRHLEGKIADGIARWQGTSEELASVESALGEKERLVKEQEKNLTVRELRLVSLRDELSSLRENVGRARARETHLVAKQEELGSLKRELERQLSLVTEETAELKARLDELRATHSGLLRQAGEQRSRLAELESEASRDEESRQALEAEIAERSEEEAKLAGESQKLEGLLGALQRTAIDHRRKKELMLETLKSAGGSAVGLLEDLVRIPAELSAAFDAILYEYGAVVVTGDEETARRCFTALEALPGRFSILVADGRPSEHSGPGYTLGESGGAGVREAIDEVECDAELRHSLRALLGRTFVVEKEQGVERLSAKGETNVRFVTRDGSILLKGRMMTGGKPSQPGNLEVSAELDKGGRKLESIRASLSDCRQALASLRDGRSGLERTARETSSRLKELRQEISALEMNVSVLAAEKSLLENRLGSLSDSGKELEERISSHSDELVRIEQELAGLAVSLAPMSERLETQSSVVGALENERESALAELSELRLSEVKEFSRKNGLFSLLRRLEEERTILEAEVERKRLTLTDSASGLETGGGELVSLEEQAATLGTSQEQKKSRLEEARSSYNAVRSEIDGVEQQLKSARKELERISEEVHLLEMDLTRQRIEREGVVRRMQSDYSVDLTAESVIVPDGFDPAAAETRLEDLRQSLRTIGPVNLLALEEYEARKERLNFMTAQRDDLLQARGSLLEVIEKINQKASAMFLETFNSVQEKFQETFTTLFDGGAAQLRLVGDDPLEATIEIVARPKGKSLQSLNLLSGGERALTAIALLFAIYRVKPSPFCMLDEVDAPLDDANINRFVGMLRRFSDRTQFIVITHNKKTMEAGDCLYGITMQEPGVSKVVSVKIRGTEEPEEAEQETAAVGS